MKKRNLFSMLIALSLVGVIMVGASLAYLTDITDEKVNTFTVGNVKIRLDEPSWEPEKGENLEPGAVVPKDPIVTNTGKNDTYVMVEVKGMAEMLASGFKANVNTTDWVKVDKNGVAEADWTGALADGYYVYKTSFLQPKQVTASALFDEVEFTTDADKYFQNVTIHEVAVDPEDESAGVYYTVEGIEGKFNTYEEAEAKATEIEAKRTYKFDLILKAYGIQTKGFDMVDGTGVYAWVAEFFK